MSIVRPRLVYANRCQCEIRTESLDQLLPAEHRVRDVWRFVETLDLSSVLTQIRSLPGRAGAPAIDPRILLALWLQATIDGIGSSRALAELCEQHLVYRWLCGGVEIGYHTLADFRTGHGEVLKQLLTETVAVLLHEGVIDLNRVAQDGMRVRAAAGASSFRRARRSKRAWRKRRNKWRPCSRKRTKMRERPADASSRRGSGRRPSAVRGCRRPKRS